MANESKEIFVCPSCESIISSKLWERLVWWSEYNKDWMKRLTIIGIPDANEYELFRCPLCEDGYVARKVRK